MAKPQIHSPVISGMPQGSVLASSQFLIYNKDDLGLSQSIGSKLVLYANDKGILLYHSMLSGSDYAFLQQDLDVLGI